MMDRRQVADIRAGTADEVRGTGSGYVVGQRLVLTCRHVVGTPDGRAWPRLDVRLGPPDDSVQPRLPAAVIWQHPQCDVALLRIDGDLPAVAAPVRWGWFAGDSPVRYTGLGFPEFADYGSGRGIEQLRGDLSPLGVGPDGSHVLDQAAAPSGPARRWPGVSGTAVFCGPLLVGVMVLDDRAFDNRRLFAVPAEALIADPDFVRLITADTGAPPLLETVELSDFLQPPASQAGAPTPGSLLAASVELVGFTGRDAELSEMAGWRDGPERFSVLLVAGEGGQGKTRLAREFAARTRQAGWAAGFLAERGASPAGGSQPSPPYSVTELARHLEGLTRPALLVADYAETRPGEIAELSDQLVSGPRAHPVRLLLLSRSAGSWWHNLTLALDTEITRRLDLAPIAPGDDRKQEIYAAAVTSLAGRLATFRDSPVERPPLEPWDVLAARLAAQPPDLSDPRLGSVLTLQITALTDLLAVAGGQEPTRSGGHQNRELARREMRYLERVAARRKLFERGVLSDRLDDDDRVTEVRPALERALAGAILLGPCHSDQARASGALASADKAEEVARWLADLYPPPSEEYAFGTVQPDRLAELLLGPILTSQVGLLRRIAALADELSDARDVLFGLARTASHPEFSQVSEQISDLIAARPRPFAVVAPLLTAAVPDPGPLQDGLVRLGQEDKEAFEQTVYLALASMPSLPVSSRIKASLLDVMADTLRRLAADNPDAYLPNLAVTLANLSLSLADSGQQQEALGPAQLAAHSFRQLAADDPNTYLPELANSLRIVSKNLVNSGQQKDALAPTQEAADIRRRLAADDPGAYLPDLASSLYDLALRLAETGQPRAAVAVAQEAVDIRRRLADIDPDTHLPYLAKSSHNLALLLAGAGQAEAAVAPAREAVSIRRRLVGTAPDTHLPELASSLNNLAVQMGETGQQQEALASSREAVGIYRRLADSDPDSYLQGLAMSLRTHAVALELTGQAQATLAVAREAADIGQQLGDSGTETALKQVAASLTRRAQD